MPDIAQRRELRYQSLREPVYIVGQNWQFEWYPAEIERVIAMYSASEKLSDMARKAKKTPWEVLMLLNDLYEQGRIERREGWVWVR